MAVQMPLQKSIQPTTGLLKQKTKYPTTKTNSYSTNLLVDVHNTLVGRYDPLVEIFDATR